MSGRLLVTREQHASGESDGVATQPNLSRKENRAVKYLRLIIFPLFLCTAVTITIGTFSLIQNQEADEFDARFEADATKVIESFNGAVERKLNAVNNLAVAITSYARNNNLTFPNVTLPDFEVWGSAVRVSADVFVVHWLPLVTDEDRAGWEEYAFQNRHHIDEAFVSDAELRKDQDREFGLDSNMTRLLKDNDPNEYNGDDSGFHLQIWSNQGRGVDEAGSGPYLPQWQRSPINHLKQSVLNMNFATTPIFQGVLHALLVSEQAVLSRAAVPLATGQTKLNANLLLSQFRHNIDQYKVDPVSFMAYPVFDRFQGEKKLVGVLATNLYWRLYFSDIITSFASGMVVVLEDPFNKTMTYRIEGSDVHFLGEGDHHEPRYNKKKLFTNVNSHVREGAKPETRAYTTVPLDRNHGSYMLHVYPSQELEDEFMSSKPAIYTATVAAIFAFTAVLFLAYDYCGERRQKIVHQQALEHAHQAAMAEQEINTYIAHEIRNPLAAAVAACNFVSKGVENSMSGTAQDSARQDVKVIQSSLIFMDDILGGLLEWHRASRNDVVIKSVPVNVREEIFEPVRGMVYDRDGNFELTIDCAEDIFVLADSLRLQEVVLNLARNSARFVKNGFIHFSAVAEAEKVIIAVEDSGLGISKEDSQSLFSKVTGGLDRLNRGTGVGLCLSKELVCMMGGEIWFDDSYSSGLEGRPGARFVISLCRTELPEETNIACSTVASSMAASSESFQPIKPVILKEEAFLPQQLAVLFVDDDKILRKLFKRVILSIAPDWELSEAESGEEALSRVDDGSCFDIIFLDQYMPGVERQLLGTDTARELRERGVDCIICGLSANDIGGEFLEAGADGFLLKPLPCNDDELRSTLLELLHSRKLNTR